MWFPCCDCIFDCVCLLFLIDVKAQRFTSIKDTLQMFLATSWSHTIVQITTVNVKAHPNVMSSAANLITDIQRSSVQLTERGHYVVLAKKA